MASVDKGLQNWALYARHELNTKDCNQGWQLGDDSVHRQNVYNHIFDHIYNHENTCLTQNVNGIVEYDRKEWKDKTRDHSEGWFRTALTDLPGSNKVEQWWDPDMPGSQHGSISTTQRDSLIKIMKEVDKLGARKIVPPVEKTIKGLFTSVTKKVPSTISDGAKLKSDLKFKFKKKKFWVTFSLKKIVEEMKKSGRALSDLIIEKLNKLVAQPDGIYVKYKQEVNADVKEEISTELFKKLGKGITRTTPPIEGDISTYPKSEIHDNLITAFNTVFPDEEAGETGETGETGEAGKAGEARKAGEAGEAGEDKENSEDASSKCMELLRQGRDILWITEEERLTTTEKTQALVKKKGEEVKSTVLSFAKKAKIKGRKIQVFRKFSTKLKDEFRKLVENEKASKEKVKNIFKSVIRKIYDLKEVDAIPPNIDPDIKTRFLDQIQKLEDFWGSDIARGKGEEWNATKVESIINDLFQEPGSSDGGDEEEELIEDTGVYVTEDSTIGELYCCAAVLAPTLRIYIPVTKLSRIKKKEINEISKIVIVIFSEMDVSQGIEIEKRKITGDFIIKALNPRQIKRLSNPVKNIDSLFFALISLSRVQSGDRIMELLKFLNDNKLLSDSGKKLFVNYTEEDTLRKISLFKINEHFITKDEFNSTFKGVNSNTKFKIREFFKKNGWQQLLHKTTEFIAGQTKISKSQLFEAGLNQATLNARKTFVDMGESVKQRIEDVTTNSKAKKDARKVLIELKEGQKLTQKQINALKSLGGKSVAGGFFDMFTKQGSDSKDKDHLLHHYGDPTYDGQIVAKEIIKSIGTVYNTSKITDTKHPIDWSLGSREEPFSVTDQPDFEEKLLNEYENIEKFISIANARDFKNNSKISNNNFIKSIIKLFFNIFGEGDSLIEQRHQIVPLYQGSGRQWGTGTSLINGVLEVPNSRKFIFVSVCTDDMVAVRNINDFLNNFLTDAKRYKFTEELELPFGLEILTVEKAVAADAAERGARAAQSRAAAAAAEARAVAEAKTPAAAEAKEVAKARMLAEAQSGGGASTEPESGGKRQSRKRFLRKNKKRSHSRGGKLLRKLSHRFNKKQQTRKQKRKNSLRRRKNKLNKKTKQR